MRTALVLFVVLAVGCSAATPPTSGPTVTPQHGSATPTAPSAAIRLEPTVEVSPSAALLTEIGETRQLTAQAVDIAGIASTGAATWTSSHPDKVSVAADGTITAVATGSSQVTADINGVRSAPVMVIVTKPAAGAKLVTDDQIVGDPVATEPAAEPSPTNTYQVTFSDPPPSVGELLAGTGEKAIAGRVEGVTGQVVTMSLVPLAELLPDLELSEVIDLSRAAVDVAPGMTDLFDVTRTGDTFDFTPKPNFMELLPPPAGGSVGPPLARVGGPQPFEFNDATGELQYVTYAIPFFDQCKASVPTVPLQLAVPPAFSYTISPDLDYSWTATDKHIVATASPTFKLAGGFKVTAGFSGRVACEKTLFTFKIPVGGALSWFVSGLVPVKAELTVGGKLTVAAMELGSEVKSGYTVEMGLRCTPDLEDCTVSGSHSPTETQFTPKIVAPAFQFRAEPFAELAGRVEFKIGNPFLQSFRLDLVMIKAGLKLTGDWAPRIMQMSDPAYRSNWKLTGEAGLFFGTRLVDVALLLGLPALTAAEVLKVSAVLAQSPTGKLTLDRPAYAAGDQVSAVVNLDPSTLEILGQYDIEQVLLYQRQGNSESLLASLPGSAGESQYAFSFPASGTINATDIFPFVVSRVPALDVFSLELERGGPRLGFFKDLAAWTADTSGAGATALTLSNQQPAPAPMTVYSPTGEHIAYLKDGGFWVAKSDGSDAHRIADAWPGWAPQNFFYAAWTPGEQQVLQWLSGAGVQIANLDGTNLRTVPINAINSIVAISPDGSKLLFSPGGTIKTTNLDGTNEQIIKQAEGDCAGGSGICKTYRAPGYSPDGSRLVFSYSVGENDLDQLAIMNADGSGLTVILPDAHVPGIMPPAWSPDGGTIAFVRYIAPGDFEIWAINPDGSNLRKLLDVPDQPGPPFPYWFQAP